MYLLKYLLLSAICLGVSYIAFRLFLGNGTQFRHQRLFLVASLILSLLLPLTGLRIDYKDISGNETETFMLVQPLPTGPGQESFTAEGPVGLRITPGFFLKLYLIITLIFMVYTAFQFTRIIRLYRISEKTMHYKGLILSHDGIRSPFSFFRWIFIPKEVTDREERESIILHESIHVSQYHSLDNLLVQLAAALMWFNPLIWMMKRSLHLVHEYLADEGTLSAGIDRLKYRALLINQVTEGRLICLSSSFNNSLIKKRMIMMTKSKNMSRNNIKILTLLPLLASLLIMVSLLNGFFPAEAKAEVTDNSAASLRATETIAGTGTEPDTAPKTLAGIPTEPDAAPKALAGIPTEPDAAPKALSGIVNEQDTVKIITSGKTGNVVHQNTAVIITDENTGIVVQKDTAKNKTSVTIRVAGDGNKSMSGEMKVVGYGDSKSSQTVVYIVDGVKTENINGLDPETIESIDVLKEDNLIVIRTKKPDIRQVEISGVTSKSVTISKSSSLPDNILFVVDGKIVDKSLFEKIDPGQIIVVEVMKGKEQIRKYTDKDFEGVIIVTTREKEE